MYNTRGLFLPNFSSQDVRPCHNLAIYEDLFLYEYTRFLLHKRLVVEGLLSPYANPFYLLMDTVYRETNKEIARMENKKIDKQTIADTLQKKAEDIKLQEESINNNNKDEWKEVQHSKTKHKPKQQV